MSLMFMFFYSSVCLCACVCACVCVCVCVGGGGGEGGRGVCVCVCVWGGLFAYFKLQTLWHENGGIKGTSALVPAKIVRSSHP